MCFFFFYFFLFSVLLIHCSSHIFLCVGRHDCVSISTILSLLFFLSYILVPLEADKKKKGGGGTDEGGGGGQTCTRSYESLWPNSLLSLNKIMIDIIILNLSKFFYMNKKIYVYSTTLSLKT